MSPIQPNIPSQPSLRQPLTLCVDCGGGGVKANVIDIYGTPHGDTVRTPTPYPLSPERLVDTIEELAGRLPTAQRITVGIPGMIRHGVVIHTPHYVNRAGPRTRLSPTLISQWRGYDMVGKLEETFSLPTLVLNDAEVHAAGLVTGRGLEVVITLGTGIGCTVFDSGKIAPHLEISHAPFKWGLTYDDFIGEHERLRLGDSHWSRRVKQILDALQPVFWWDRLYIGGGNSRRISSSVRDRFPENVTIVSNNAAIIGGVRAWDLLC